MTKKDEKKSKETKRELDLFNPAEVLIIRSALLNYRKAPFVSDMENEIIGELLKRLVEDFNL
tara:strand:- start:5494 stop:5679 length:186 start_codon:yes stop_codon:yes gene_type:complete